MYLTNNGIVKDSNEDKSVYLKLVSDNPTTNNNDNKATENKTPALKPDLFKNTIQSSDIITNDKNIVLFDNSGTEKHNYDYLINNEVKPDNNKNSKKETAQKAIDKTRTVITLANTFAKVTQNNQLEDLLNSSEGALNVSQGVIDLNSSANSDNKAKTIMSAVSQVSNGVGTVLGAIDIPEAQFLKFTGQVVGLGVEQQNLNENIKKKDARGIAGYSVSLVRGAWGAVLSGTEAVKLGANIGAKMGVVNLSTVEKITNTSSSITRFADKVAIPFSVANSGLTLWDWTKSIKKVGAKEEQVAELEQKVNEDENSSDIMQLAKEIEDRDKAKVELKNTKINSAISGVSFGLSAVSTAAMIVSVAAPSVSRVTGAIALGTSIASSVVNVVSDEHKRDNLVNTYKNVKQKYDKTLVQIDNFVFHKDITN